MTSFFNYSIDPHSYRLKFLGLRCVTLALLFSCLLSFSCSGGGTNIVTHPPPNVVSVSVSPNPASVRAGASQPFTSTVSNSTDQNVTWSLSGAGCSAATCGTLTAVTASSITYNAPSSAPTPPTVTLTATSAADTTKSGSAAITITTTSGSNVPALVQHVSHSSTQDHFVSTYLVRLTFPSGSGNCVLVGVQSSHGSTPTMTDDAGNAYTRVVTGSDSTNTNIALFKASITHAGAQKLVVSFSTAAQFVAAEASEFMNVDPSCTGDGTATNSGTGTALTAGSVTTTTDGDLVYAFGIQDTNPKPVTSWTAGGGFSLLGADVMDGHFTEWEVQSATGSINPSATLATSNGQNTWLMATMAIKPGTSGTAPNGIHGVHNLHLALPAGQGYPFTVQFPCTTTTGPVVVIGNAEPSNDFVSLSDTNTNHWTKRGAATTMFSGLADIFDTDAGATACTTNMFVTINKSGTDITGSTLIFIDVAGAIAHPAFDSTPGYVTAGGAQSTAGDVAGASVTATTAHGACFASMAVDANSIIGVSPPALFLSSTATPEPPDFQDDENNGYAVVYNPGTTAFRFTWQENAAVTNWANGVTCYKAP